jgi:ArsR family transcriptional regulator
MKTKTNHVNQMFRAFSDPTRLRILNLLKDGELCVGDLVAALRVSQPKASRHLAFLRRAGLVQTDKRGLWNYYRLAPAKNSVHGRLLDCLGECFKEVPEVSADAARLSKAGKKGGCCPS